MKNTRQLVLLTSGERDFQTILDNHHHTFPITIAIPESKKLSLNGYDEDKVIFLDASCDNIPKCKNAIIKAITSVASVPQYLHIIEDDVIITSDEYIDRIEKMMDLLELEYWCNGYTNAMNTIFTKKSPRFIMNLGKYAVNDIDTIEFTAHESNEHMVFKLIEEGPLVQFHPQLNLLYNIEFIYRMHKKDPKKYFLNFYPTIPLERTELLRDIIRFPHKNPDESRYNIKEEESIMKELNVEWKPHTIVDELIHRVEECVMTKKKEVDIC
jgi:hypothetical protein